MSKLSYLYSRCLDAETIKLLNNNDLKSDRFIPFIVNKHIYCIHHFLDDSNILGYDVEETNKQLLLDKTEFVAVALVEGDDVIVVNSKNGCVYLWLIQNGDREMISIAKSLSEFLELSVESSQL